MYRLFALGTLALAIVFTTALAEDKKDEKAVAIDKIMEDAHGKDGLRAQVVAAAKEKKLEDAKKPAEEWAKLAADLGKNKPPKGEAASWKKLSAAYEKEVKALAAAVKGDKPAAVSKSLKAIGASCAGCHKEHKE